MTGQPATLTASPNRTQTENGEAQGSFRIALIDLVRGAALIAMTIYHFGWDLAMFGLVDGRFPHTPGMIWFARAIASTFLLLVGVSLVLAHGRGIRIRGYLIRLATILAAAAMISIATWFATPEAFIFFGILHSIALGSVLALAFLRFPWWVNLALAALVILIGSQYESSAFDAWYWWWSGLSERSLVSNDYVPIFPFFGMVLAGLAAGDAISRFGLIPGLARYRLDGMAGRTLRFLGRHSLIYYLAHQPILIATLAAILWLSGNI